MFSQLKFDFLIQFDSFCLPAPYPKVQLIGVKTNAYNIPSGSSLLYLGHSLSCTPPWSKTDLRFHHSLCKKTLCTPSYSCQTPIFQQCNFHSIRPLPLLEEHTYPPHLRNKSSLAGHFSCTEAFLTGVTVFHAVLLGRKRICVSTTASVAKLSARLHLLVEPPLSMSGLATATASVYWKSTHIRLRNKSSLAGQGPEFLPWEVRTAKKRTRCRRSSD